MSTWSPSCQITSSDGSVSVKPVTGGGFNLVVATAPPGATGVTQIQLNNETTPSVLPNASGVVGFLNGSGITLSSDVNKDMTITNAGVTSAVAGTGIGVSSATGAVTLSNTGVTSAVAGTGIGVSSATGAVTLSNTGVTSVVAGSGIGVSGATGAVTLTNSGVTGLTAGGTSSSGNVSLVAGSGLSISALSNTITLSSTSASANPVPFYDVSMTAASASPSTAPTYFSGSSYLSCTNPAPNSQTGYLFTPLMVYFPAPASCVTGRTYYGSWDLSLNALLSPANSGAGLLAIPSLIIGYFPGTSTAARSSSTQFWNYGATNVLGTSASISFSGPLECVSAPINNTGTSAPCIRLGIQVYQFRQSSVIPGSPPYYNSSISFANGGPNDPVTNLSGLIYGSDVTPLP